MGLTIKTIAVHVRYKSLYIFFAELCKTTKWNEQVLHILENANDGIER